MIDLMRSALWYARHGWPVFPIHCPANGGCSCGNPQCDSKAKHPRTPHGLKDASAKVAVIRDWWEQWPDANIAIATGKLTAVVLDVDPAKGGDDSLYELTEQHGSLPSTVEAITGGGGRHILFQSPGYPIHNKVGLAPGLDIRGDGGYIVVAPSLHMSGRRYQWEVESRPDKVQLAPMPRWLLSMVAEPSKPSAPIDRDAAIPDGQRNNTLARQAGAMRRWGMCEEAILAALLVENQKRCQPPLPDHEVRLIARSISRYDPERQQGALLQGVIRRVVDGSQQRIHDN